MHAAQAGGEFADRPAGEGLAGLGGAGGGRLDDEVLVFIAEETGTASRPCRIHTGQADLVEPVDHIAHGALVSPDQLGDHRDRVPADRGEQHHRPPAAQRVGAAPGHDLLLLLLLIGQSAHAHRLGHHTSSGRNGCHRHTTAPTASPVNLPGQSTSVGCGRKPASSVPICLICIAISSRSVDRLMTLRLCGVTLLQEVHHSLTDSPRGAPAASPPAPLTPHLLPPACRAASRPAPLPLCAARGPHGPSYRRRNRCPCETAPLPGADAPPQSLSVPWDLSSP